MQICKLDHRENIPLGEILPEPFKINTFSFLSFSKKDETLFLINPVEFEL